MAMPTNIGVIWFITSSHIWQGTSLHTSAQTARTVFSVNCPCIFRLIPINLHIIQPSDVLPRILRDSPWAAYILVVSCPIRCLSAFPFYRSSIRATSPAQKKPRGTPRFRSRPSSDRKEKKTQIKIKKPGQTGFLFSIRSSDVDV